VRASSALFSQISVEVIFAYHRSRSDVSSQANEICANGYDSTVKDVQPLEVDRYESRL